MVCVWVCVNPPPHPNITKFLQDKFDNIQLETCVMVVVMVVVGREGSKVMGLYYTHRSK
jgi:hypothetical protein